MGSSDCQDFQVLTDKDVETLLQSLNKCLPDSIHVLCFIKNILEFNKVSDMKGKIYAPGGDYSECTCFLFIELHNGYGSGTYYSETSRGCKRLHSALESTDLFQNMDLVVITAVHDKIHTELGTSWSEKLNLVIEEITACNLYSISKEDALAFRSVIPDDVEIRGLNESDAELVNSLWPHRTDQSVHFIRKIISASSSLGVYRRSDGSLLSWILKWFYGGLGSLQTVEEAKRKGYAKIMIAELSKRLALENWPVHATVLVKNHESNPLFEKMGFTNNFVCHYVELVKGHH